MKRLLVLFFMILGIISCDTDNDKISVVSFNMRLATDADGDNAWEFRIMGVDQFLKDAAPDLLGVQEALPNQVKFLDDVMVNHTREGVGREDGEYEGEFSAIYYNTKRFVRLDGGTFWLSETPDKVSYGWDAACKRIVTWVKLHDKKSNVDLYYLNTHLDHVGVEARRNSSKMILDKIASFEDDARVIVTGDFNATQNEEPITILLQSGQLLDSRSVASVVIGEDNTFHNFGKSNTGIIDYIFVTPNIGVATNEIITSRYGGKYLSDHNPVMAEIKLF
ncbi:MAG: endonuclease/exonuclease/phosphatase family protein [Rikenellaceae bacterium]